MSIRRNLAKQEIDARITKLHFVANFMLPVFLRRAERTTARQHAQTRRFWPAPAANHKSDVDSVSSWRCGRASRSIRCMAQRILEPGQIEQLAAHSIPRIRIPDRAQLFARRAARLRELAAASPIGDYLRLCVVVADAQDAAVADFPADLPSAAQIETAQTYGMPPIPAASWPRSPRWRATLQAICAAV